MGILWARMDAIGCIGLMLITNICRKASHIQVHAICIIYSSGTQYTAYNIHVVFCACTFKETAGTSSVAVTTSAATHKPSTSQEPQHMHRSSELAINVVSVNFMGYNPNASEQKILDREAEYMTALQRNLNYSLVARVHILTATSNVTEKRLLDFDLPYRHKIVVAQVPSADYMRDVFDYISQNLVGQDVMYINGDIYLTGGFDKIDAQAMRQRHVIYGLTRRGKQEAKCKMQDYCGVDIKHNIGSHDAFLFHLTEPIPEDALKDLDYPLGSWGSENVLLWVFQRKLKFCVLNPCTILKVYHLHCSNVRKGGKIRVNVGGKSVVAPFTNRLIC